MQQACSRHAVHMHHTCNRYATGMQQVCKRACNIHAHHACGMHAAYMQQNKTYMRHTYLQCSAMLLSAATRLAVREHRHGGRARIFFFGRGIRRIRGSGSERILLRHVGRYLRIGVGPRRSPSACSLVNQKQSVLRPAMPCSGERVRFGALLRARGRA